MGSNYKCDFVYADSLTYKLLKEKAEYNREHPTEAERIVWDFLKSNSLGVRFRNQYIIGEYIVDFIALKQKLIIEIDGEYHFTEGQQAKDEEREAYLKDKGFKVIRFTNQEVFNNCEMVMKAIRSELH